MKLIRTCDLCTYYNTCKKEENLDQHKKEVHEQTFSNSSLNKVAMVKNAFLLMSL